jgi:methylglyoxal synthase
VHNIACATNLASAHLVLSQLMAKSRMDNSNKGA